MNKLRTPIAILTASLALSVSSLQAAQLMMPQQQLEQQEKEPTVMDYMSCADDISDLPTINRLGNPTLKEFYKKGKEVQKDAEKAKWWNLLASFRAPRITRCRPQQLGFLSAAKEKKMTTVWGFLSEIWEETVVITVRCAHTLGSRLLGGEDAQREAERSWDEREINNAASWLGYAKKSVLPTIAAVVATAAAVKAAVSTGLPVLGAITSGLSAFLGAMPALALAYFGGRAAEPYIGSRPAAYLGIGIFLFTYLGIYKFVVKRVINRVGDRRRKAKRDKELAVARTVKGSDALQAIKSLFKPVIAAKEAVTKAAGKRSYFVPVVATVVVVLGVFGIGAGMYKYMHAEKKDEFNLVVDEVDQRDRFDAQEEVELATEEKAKQAYRYKTNKIKKQAKQTHNEALAISIDNQLEYNDQLTDDQKFGLIVDRDTILNNNRANRYNVNLTKMMENIDINKDRNDMVNNELLNNDSSSDPSTEYMLGGDVNNN